MPSHVGTGVVALELISVGCQTRSTGHLPRQHASVAIEDPGLWLPMVRPWLAGE